MQMQGSIYKCGTLFINNPPNINGVLHLQMQCSIYIWSAPHTNAGVHI